MKLATHHRDDIPVRETLAAGNSGTLSRRIGLRTMGLIRGVRRVGRANC